ncbi:MAG TPA: alpha/beta hydrolase [Acidimicrobiia bacterium]|jgi:dienelactone hydrolase
MHELSRRALLASFGTGAAALAVSNLGAVAGAADASPTATTIPLSSGTDTLGTGTFQLFSQTDLNFQTLFGLGEAGLNSVAGEVIAVVAAANAAPGGASYQSVYDEFIAQANRLQESALEAQQARHLVTAQSRFIRAAKYYAQALYWVLGTSTPDAEADVYTAMDAMFVKGMQLMKPRPEQIEIRYDGGTLPAWFVKPASGGARRPTVIMNNGSDGQNVDMLPQGGLAALDRGYNVVIFEGPGQGSQLFLHNVPFRPDWEKVITPIVDYLETRTDVNLDQVAIRGISFGGLLVPRAAAHEHRLGAVVADPGSVKAILDYPPIIREILTERNATDVNSTWNATIVPGATPEQKFSLMKTFEIFTEDAHDSATRGELVTDVAPVGKQLVQYDISNQLDQITSPTLVTQYEGDVNFTTEGTTLYDGLTKAKARKFVEFTAVNGAQYHCGPLAPQVSNEACWDWVDEVFDR